jgi:glucokinase
MDREHGVVAIAHNLPGFHDISLGPRLSAICGLPTLLENDANLYALGEQRYGAGRGADDLLCFTLGTGVGGGLIIGGRMVVGPLASGGEVGHLLVEPDGRRCGCGVAGCMEAYASATGLKGMLAEELAAGASSRLKLGDSPKEMAQAARQGDEMALELFQRAGRAMGRAMSQVVVLTGVDLMIMGGGMAPAWPLMEPAARRELADRLRMVDASLVRILPAELGDMAAVRGAAALARERFG